MTLASWTPADNPGIEPRSTITVSLASTTGVLEAREECVSSTGTRRYWWRYHLDTQMKSTGGRAGAPLDTPMLPPEVEWVTTNYLPRAPAAAPAGELLAA